MAGYNLFCNEKLLQKESSDMYTTIWPPMCKKYSWLDGSGNLADVQCTAFDSTLTYRSFDSTLTYRPILRYLYSSSGGLTPLKVVPQVPVVECGQVPLRKGLGPEAQHLVDLRDVGAGIQLHPWSKNTKDSSVNCRQSLESHNKRHSLWFTKKWKIESATYHSKYIQSIFLTLHCMHPGS